MSTPYLTSEDVAATSEYMRSCECEGIEYKIAQEICEDCDAVLMNSYVASVIMSVFTLDNAPCVLAVSNLCDPITLMAARLVSERYVLIDTDKNGNMLTTSNKYEEVDAILATHYKGSIVDVAELEKYGKPIIEDANTCYGAELVGRGKPGSYGHLAMYSFQDRSLIYGNGISAIIGQKDSKPFEKVLKLSNSMEAYSEHRLSSPGLSSVLLGSQLDSLNSVSILYWNLYFTYARRISSLEEPDILRVRIPNSPSPNHLVVTVDDKEEFALFLFRNDIEFRDLSAPISYLLQEEVGKYPNSERFWESSIELPIYPQLSETKLETITGVLSEYVNERKESKDEVREVRDDAEQEAESGDS